MLPCADCAGMVWGVAAGPEWCMTTCTCPQPSLLPRTQVGFPIHAFSKELLRLVQEGYLPLDSSPLAAGQS